MESGERIPTRRTRKPKSAILAFRLQRVEQSQRPQFAWGIVTNRHPTPTKNAMNGSKTHEPNDVETPAQISVEIPLEPSPQEPASTEQPPKPDRAKPSRSFPRRTIAFLWRCRPRLYLRDLFWICVLAAILMTWYRDHTQMLEEIAIRTGGARTSWSIRQVLGPPNTPAAGDRATAWASASQDGGQEWIIAEFPRATQLVKVEVVETYNPGALRRICSVNAAGIERELWKGKDPTPATVAMGSSIVPIAPSTRTRRIKIYLDSANVPGWNEIDAIALHGRDGTKQWASDAWASSAYGDNQIVPKWFWP